MSFKNKQSEDSPNDYKGTIRDILKLLKTKGNSNICRWYVNAVCFCHHKTRNNHVSSGGCLHNSVVLTSTQWLCLNLLLFQSTTALHSFQHASLAMAWPGRNSVTSALSLPLKVVLTKSLSFYL